MNGQQVTDLDSYWATSPMFNLNVPEDNVSGNTREWLRRWSCTRLHHRPAAARRIRDHGDRRGRGFDYTVNVTVEAPQIIEPTGDRSTPAERSALCHRTTINDLRRHGTTSGDQLMAWVAQVRERCAAT